MGRKRTIHSGRPSPRSVTHVRTRANNSLARPIHSHHIATPSHRRPEYASSSLDPDSYRSLISEMPPKRRRPEGNHPALHNELVTRQKRRQQDPAPRTSALDESRIRLMGLTYDPSTVQPVSPQPTSPPIADRIVPPDGKRPTGVSTRRGCYVTHPPFDAEEGHSP